MNIYLVVNCAHKKFSLERMNQMKIDDEVFNKVSLLGELPRRVRGRFTVVSGNRGRIKMIYFRGK